LKAPATGSSIEYVFLVGITTKLLIARMSARFLFGLDSLSSSYLAMRSLVVMPTRKTYSIEEPVAGAFNART
jgi:hypothetical protein